MEPYRRGRCRCGRAGVTSARSAGGVKRAGVSGHPKDGWEDLTKTLLFIGNLEGSTYIYLGFLVDVSLLKLHFLVETPLLCSVKC